jgi:hypothetical protein
MEAALAEHCFDTLFETTMTVTYGCAVIYGEHRIVLDFYLPSRMSLCYAQCV